MKKCTEDMNGRLNGYVKNDYPLADDKEWTIWATKANGAAWYTVVEDGEPSDDNIIEGETGDLMYLDLEDAKTQWGMYKTYSRIEGTAIEIDAFPTMQEARKAVQGYYNDDRDNGDFVDSIYGVAAEGDPMNIDGIINAEPPASEVSAVMAALARRRKGAKQPSSKANAEKARAAVSPERRAEILAKARAAKAEKRNKQ